VIVPSSKICTTEVRESVKGSLQIIIPPKRINFTKHVMSRLERIFNSRAPVNCRTNGLKTESKWTLAHLTSHSTVKLGRQHFRWKKGGLLQGPNKKINRDTHGKF